MRGRLHEHLKHVLGDMRAALPLRPLHHNAVAAAIKCERVGQLNGAAVLLRDELYRMQQMFDAVQSSPEAA